MKHPLKAIPLAFAAATVSVPVSAALEPVTETYVAIAQSAYEDSLISAREMREAIAAFLEAPSDATLEQARSVWVEARVPYQQTEVYRFGNAVVDEWEGKVNAWPLDEGLIDYVDADAYGTESEENTFYAANIIANPTLMVAGRTIDATTIDTELLQSLHEVDEVEANVSTGYHAIEFLLWGQDLNGTGPGAGQRPASDFMTGADCTGGNCDRRRAYLTAATDLLIADLEDIVAAWGPDGEARAALEALSATGQVAVMLTGMGSLSYGELAGERMQLGLMLHDPEEEHDCFSDNTHNSHYDDARGIYNVYHGRYQRIDGSVVEGPSLASLVSAAAADLDAEMRAGLDATAAAMQRMKDTADSGAMSYDQMLGEDNPEGNALVSDVVEALKAQTRVIERVAVALGVDSLELEGSDSLDNPDAVFQ